MTTKSSKFTGFFDARSKQAEDEENDTQQEQSPPEPNGQDEQPKGRGRGGKRTNPNFVQVTAYIHKDTHKAAKRALLDEDAPREFSELVQDLLNDWLKLRT
jgi:hypothetical protein